MDTKQSLPSKSNNLSQTEAQIKKKFMDPKNKHQYISFQDFLKHFAISQQNFKQENLNIIDVHLRYRWYARERMAPYKWIPILCLTPIFFRSLGLCIFIPIFTVKMFDHYFQRFFVWRYRKDKIINIRNEFVTKLSKQKNKMKRIVLFQQLKDSLYQHENLQEEIKADNKQIQAQTKDTLQKVVQKKLNSFKEQDEAQPFKYIKFGQFSQYIFHSQNGDKEQSSILQTTLFDNYLNMINCFKGIRPFAFFRSLYREFKEDFFAFKEDPDRKKYTIDVDLLIQSPYIKEEEIYTLEENIDHNVRRFSELWQYMRRGTLQPSNFNIWQYTNLSKYESMLQSAKYNAKSNSPDLLIYYSIIIVPKLLSYLFKRR